MLDQCVRLFDHVEAPSVDEIYGSQILEGTFSSFQEMTRKTE